MAYWGAGPAENDYAFDEVGVIALLIKERMLKDAEAVIKEAHPEQGIVASVRCLRLLDAEFPKCVRLAFRKKGLANAERLFEKWYGAVSGKLPEKHREAIRSGAHAEFSLYREQLGA
ncbi:MAG: hypothetical protein AAF533_04910 [Acidobacteriota bacterium]